MAERTIRIQVTLTDEEADAVRKDAAERSVKEKKRVSMSDVIRELVIDHFQVGKARKKSPR